MQLCHRILSELMMMRITIHDLDDDTTTAIQETSSMNSLPMIFSTLNQSDVSLSTSGIL